MNPAGRGHPSEAEGRSGRMLLIVGGIAALFLVGGVLLLWFGGSVARIAGLTLIVFGISAVPTAFAGKRSRRTPPSAKT
jgi:membrane protein implicated in regulation of membrane protease activity